MELGGAASVQMAYEEALQTLERDGMAKGGMAGGNHCMSESTEPSLAVLWVGSGEWDTLRRDATQMHERRD